MSGEKMRSFEEKVLDMLNGRDFMEEEVGDAELEGITLAVKKKVGYLSPEVLDNPPRINDARMKLGGPPYDTYKLYQGNPRIMLDALKGIVMHWLELCKYKVKYPQDPRVQFALDLLRDQEIRKLLKSRQILGKGKIKDEQATALEMAQKLFDLKTYDSWFTLNLEGGRRKNLSKLDVIKLIDFRRAQMEKREVEFQEKLPALMAKVKAIIMAAKDRFGWNLSTEKIENIMPRIEVALADPLVAKFEKELSGGCDMFALSIIIDPDLNEEQTEKTMVHEVLHALSGKSFLYDEDDRFVRPMKEGLLFPNEKGGPRSLLEWLNESVTEKLAMMTTGAKDGFYEEERKVLDALCEKVPFGLFQEAYFEDFDERQPVGSTTAKFTALSQAIRKAFGDRFLVRLDECITKKGAKVAYEKFFGGSAESAQLPAEQATN